MAGNFEFMWEKLPQIMRGENTRKYYKSISAIFDNFDSLIESGQYAHVIDYAAGGDLDILGRALGIPRGNYGDEAYRMRLRVYYYTFYFVPTLNNFLYLIRDVMGYYPENVVEGWTKALNPESALLSIDVIIPAGADDNLLVDLDDIAAAGVRIDWTKIQETYAVYHSTSDSVSTHEELTTPFDSIIKVNLEETPGSSPQFSTGRTDTASDVEYIYDFIDE